MKKLFSNLTAMIQYNKLYQSLKKVSAEWHGGQVLWEYTWNYLSFSNDGICILFYSNSEKPLNDENLFFGKNPDVTLGKFTIANNEIRIDFGSDSENIGMIQNDKLILYSKNKVVPFGKWDVYSLIK